ncbi:hypothetical protein ACQKKX_06975 [Neorhizobium sp. NPDC001467]|uniref:hypothetical protein n=1 Tax=Neorhizobium sp. NPDC001467 TaxID=3390595 RepID=UPI003CFEA61E
MIDSEIAAVQQARNTVSDTDVRAFSTRDYRRVFVFGRGHFAALSSFIALRLTRSGYVATELGSRMDQLAETLIDDGRSIRSLGEFKTFRASSGLTAS